MRSVYGGSLDKSNLDEVVTLCGWVDRRRDHGGVIFIDLRDREGIVQVVFDPDAEENFALADKVRSEYVLQVTGKVRARSNATVNKNMHYRRDRSLRYRPRDPKCIRNRAFSAGFAHQRWRRSSLEVSLSGFTP